MVAHAFDSNPAEVRCYRGELFVRWARQPFVGKDSYAWDMSQPLELPIGRISALRSVGAGIRAASVEHADVQVRFRAGGERCHPSDRRHSQTLKRLFQEWGIAPWLRDEIPLIFVDGEIAAVGDVCVCRGFAAASGEQGYSVQWVCNP